MADIFLSYARADKDKAVLIKTKLEELGYSVFFDTEGLDGGDVFPDILDREVKNAKAVVGVWSRHSLTRPWVKIECDIGRARGVLVPVQIEDIPDLDRPAAFWNIQFDDLSSFKGNTKHEGWQKFVRSLDRVLRKQEPQPPKQEEIKGNLSPPVATSEYILGGIDYAHISQLFFTWEGKRFLAIPGAANFLSSGSKAAKEQRNGLRDSAINLKRTLALTRHNIWPSVKHATEELRKNPANNDMLSTVPTSYEIYSLPHGSFESERSEPKKPILTDKQQEDLPFVIFFWIIVGIIVFFWASS